MMTHRFRTITLGLSAAVALATPAFAEVGTPAPYVSDSQTALLYHFDEPAGAAVAADMSGQNRDGVYEPQVLHAGGLAGFGAAVRAVPTLNELNKDTGDARVIYEGVGEGTSSFLYTGAQTGFTIEAWVMMPDGLTTSTPQSDLLIVRPDTYQGGAGNNAGGLDYELYIEAGNNPYGRAGGVTIRDNTGLLATTGALAWDAGVWYHVALTVEPGPAGQNIYKFYWNRAGDAAVTLVSTTTNRTPVMNSSTGDRMLEIGSFYYGQTTPASRYFPGYIDELRFSTVARDAEDLQRTLGPTVPQQIRQEALAPNNPHDCPLPLMSTWSTDWYSYYYNVNPAIGFNPAWQVDQINAGHYLLPDFQLPDIVDESSATYQKYVAYYQSAIGQVAQWKLPLVLIGTQWEKLLYDANYSWFSLPYADNPNMVESDLTVRAAVSGFGPTIAWEQVGQTWSSSLVMQLLQTLYPEPPRVIFVSNNEAAAEQWSPQLTNNVEVDKHYLDLYGAGRSGEFKREKLAEGWITRYRAMQQGWRDGVVNDAWKDNAMFIAYNAAGLGFFSRWDDWMKYSLYTPNRVSPDPLMWDGGSYSYYVGPPYGDKDYQVMSPQLAASNLVFQQDEAHQLNPGFWWELSAWNGSDSHPATWPTNWPGDYTPERYAGMVKFGMWMLRPRVVRHFSGWSQPRTATQPWYDVLQTAVDQVHVNATLKAFWRDSELVANTARPHPYQKALPAEYQGVQRMYMLDADANPADVWTPLPYPAYFYRQVTVYAMARVRHEAPQRQWLIYAQAPVESVSGVTVTVPGYAQQVVLPTVTPGGNYYLVDEAAQTVAAVE